MSSRAGWVLSLSLVCRIGAAAEPAPPQPVTVIRAGTLIDGVSGSAKTNQVIVIRGNRIESVGHRRARRPERKVIDLSGATVLPGMIDAHTHVFLQGEEPAAGGYDVQLLKYPLAYRAARAAVAARRALEQGFTTIRDVETEGAGYGDVGIKRAIEEGHIPGPRMFVSTRAISTHRRLQPRGLRAGGRRSRRGRSSSTGRWRRGRRRASSSRTGPTGSRCT